MFGDTVKVRGLRSVILEADRVLHAGEVASVKPLQAAILRECNGAELVDPDDLPKLHAAVDKENRRVLREVSRPAHFPTRY